MQHILHRKLSIVDGAFVPDEETVSKKKLLIRLVTEIHNAGNLCWRTEKLCVRVANTLGLHATITILPRRMILGFQESLALDPSKSECYTLCLGGGLNISKLSALEQLVFDFTKSKVLSFEQAQSRLEEIDKEPVMHGPWTIALLHFAVSYIAAVIFYGGNAIDAAWSGLFGAAVYGIERLSDRLEGLEAVTAFVSSAVVAICSTLLDRYAYSGNLCLFASMYGGVIWILPGYSITMALVELYSGMVVYGSSRLLFGISQASQVGFGLALGHAFVAGGSVIPDSFVNGCRDPSAKEWGLLLLPIFGAIVAAILNTGRSQLPGMMLTAWTAFFADYALHKVKASESVVPFVSAILVTTTARLWAWFNRNERPLVYIISGLFILVPGGVGVKGSFQSTLTGNGAQGLLFTTNMVSIAISLAVGVFLSLVPTTKWLRARRPRMPRVSLHFTHSPSLGPAGDGHFSFPHSFPHISLSIPEDSEVDDGDSGDGSSVRNPMSKPTMRRSNSMESNL